MKKRIPNSKKKPKKPIVQKDLRADRPYVVGIGASAGGLEALRALFGAIKSADDMSFVIVQHLAPQHRSRLVELIAHTTKIPVREAKDGTPLEVGVAYVTPPNRDAFLEDGLLRLRPPHVKVGPKPSIDLFFQSLAEDARELAIGVILSGTGTDGAMGIRAIKEGGGVTMSQKIDSAKYDGMPKAALQTGLVDFELTPEEIAQELARVRGHRKSRAALLPLDAAAEDPYDEILHLVEKAVGASFSLYKRSTIRRRIDRRVVATRCDDVESYMKYLAETPDEAQMLFQDILISVTSFFRDPPAWRVLDRMLAERIRNKSEASVFKCWIVGCATGEEAYSLAILVREVCLRLKKELNIQIFATDLDEQALVIARKGIYSKASLVDLPPPLQDKYFNSLDDERAQIKPAIRDIVIFARHNVVQDPPFLKLDLASCRNVLIYFTNKLQEKVFKTLHYSLDKKGVLFLGKSEAVPLGDGAFNIGDKNAKIYLRTEKKGEMPRTFGKFEVNREAQLIANERSDSAGSELFNALITGLAPDSMIVDEEQRIRHVYGNAGKFLNIPAGEASYTIIKLLPMELGLELAALLHRSQKNNASSRGRHHELRDESRTLLVQMTVCPLQASGKRTFLVSFDSREAPALEVKKKPKNTPESSSVLERLSHAEKELVATREHLQTVIEEQETSNEELQSLNEELQSANEELQSSNEELETANEELQSTNEELTTLNQELNVKTAELHALNQTLQAIQSAIIYPLLIVDKNLKLVNFNPAAQFLLRLTEQDIGTHIRAIPSFIDLSGVVPTIENSLKKENEAGMQFRTKDRSFEVQVQVFRGTKDSVHGAVVTFVDNTEISTALEEAKLIKRRLSDILENTPAIVTMKDTSGVIIYANRRFCELVGRKEDDVVGQTDEEIFGGTASEALRERDYEVIKKRVPIEFEEKVEAQGNTMWWSSSKFPLLDSKRRVQSVCTVSLDVTGRMNDQKTIAAQQEELSLFGRFAALGEVAAGIAHEINTPLNVITAKSDIIRKLAERDQLEKARLVKAAVEIDQMAKNISGIVMGLKSLVKKDATRAERTNINQLIVDTLKVCEYRFHRYGVELILDLPKTDVYLDCFAVQISQILINLVNNSIDAISSLTSAKWVKVQVTETKGAIEIVVTDCGEGIDQAVAEKIMTPFFTTKKEGQGTGIGLSLSRTIARRHGGDLNLDPTNKNTSFKLELPKLNS